MPAAACLTTSPRGAFSFNRRRYEVARIRTIKPEFWTDSKTGTLSDRATKLFIGMLTFSDDYGVVEFDLPSLRAKIFPFSMETPEEVIGKALLEELLPRGLLTMFGYSENEAPPYRRYLFITNFPRHQRIDRPGKPLIPGWSSGTTPENYEAGGIQFDERSSNTRRMIGEGSSNVPRSKGMEGKGMERKGGNLFPDNGAGKAPSVSWAKAITWNKKDGCFEGITHEMILNWKEAYPAVDLKVQLKRADEWLKANPNKTKKNYYRFITNWMGRSQEKGGR